MPSNNSKYSEEFREQTVRHIFETGKSATSMAEEKGIRSAPPKDSVELKQRIKELEAKIKEKDKEIEQKNKKLQEEKQYRSSAHC